ncbi:pre-mRNA-splicing factor CWC25 homolog [Toxorhynchites rutilus septentrionalis]|uniref:pre-mRNA-splicing factor CWC25 homolog n=1 Tax=Toxorhynchites rutilus septentrionalis TaxID=329112 RepID=UPI00247A074B|nr:pre-mRNA-splicing factor CWC25 homolog [Toxorhynchites rutilus septentrionalis]
MGGGDLNTKKSWHPNTFKNQERVWKAEQADAAEKRKLAELQHEINAERDREELKSIAKKSGLIANDDGDRKLEWMYKGAQVNREEYLLGRSVDKTFEQLDAQEKAGPSVGITQPKNHVEHECIPFSIRQYKGLEGTEQVDITRKLMEDPLMAIKQKEIESRQKILENPVKLKELHRLLKSDQSIKDRKKTSKKSKKVKKSKKKKKRTSSSNESDSEVDDKDLDKMLAEKYKKVQNTMSSNKNEDVNLDKLLTLKYQKLSKELNKLAKPKKSKKKMKKRSSSVSDESGSSSDESYTQNKGKHRSKERDRPRGSRALSRSQSLEKHKRYRNRSRSPNKSRDRNRSRSRDRRSRERSSKQNRMRSKERSERRKSPVSSESSRSPTPEKTRRGHNRNDDDEVPARSKNFGLVSASGKKLELTKRDEVRLYKREEIKAQQSSLKPAWKRPESRKPLTEEELEAKRKAMLENAEWRDKERQRNVKRYEDEDRRQELKDKQKKYDKDFINQQFKHAANNETVEKRIKSNRNNIQRSGGAMNDNFARR